MNGLVLESADAPIVPATREPESVTMFERLAKDPTVPVEKLERLIELQRSIMRDNAKAEFDSAFSAMQGEIPIITERGEILVEGRLRSKYATNEDIQEQVKPILQKHGFALRFRNEVLDGGKLKIVGILSHRSGHSEQDEFVTKADDSGKKNDIQAIGSARAYGQRYCTLALLNIATRGADDDGAKAGRKEEPKAAPEGYPDWLDTMTAVSDEGLPKLEATFRSSKPEFRKHVTTQDALVWARLKTKAGAVK